MGLRLSKSIVGKAEAEAVARVILEDGYLGMGNEVRLFEQEVAAFLGVDPGRVISVNTGTAAVHLAVQAVCSPADEVLVPSLTFLASFQAISAAGCVPVACDILEETCTIDMSDAAKRIGPKTRAIMPVHYASNPWKLDEVYTFAREHNLRVIEDAAHAFGCRHNGKMIGSFGDMVCFSFDGIKNITCGEGGCIVAHDEAAAQICKDARLLSVRNDTEKRYAGARSWDFDVTRQGYRYHMSNIMAAIGRVQLKRLPEEFGPARLKLAELYRQKLSGVDGIKLFRTDPNDHVIPHIFPILITSGRKKEVVEGLDAAGIPTGVHYKPNHLLTFYGGGSLSLPVTERVYAQNITLPLHPEISEADANFICAKLLKIVRSFA